MSSQASRVLRAATFRISTTAPEALVNVIPSVAASLLDAKILFASSAPSTKDSSDGVSVHKFKTQINTLLNAKTAEGRWAGCVLVKTTIELGGYEVLSKCAGWVRSLLQSLNQSDAASAKTLIIITLTRIFDLTHEFQSLVREITTPSLKDFVQICVGLVSTKTNGQRTSAQGSAQHVLLPSVLESFVHLLPSHPSIFRPYVAQLREVIAPLIASRASPAVPQRTASAARKLFALLHFSTPKANNNSPATAQAKCFESLVRSAHVTASLTFRSIVEDWSPLLLNDVPTVKVPLDIELTSTGQEETLGLPSWSGINPGLDRLRGYLTALRDTILSASSEQSVVPIGTIIDLLVRICNVTAPPAASSGKTKQNQQMSGMRTNDQIAQAERDALFIELPSVHTSVMEVMSALCTRFGTAVKPHHETFLEQITWVFQRENFNDDLRSACYSVLAELLDASAAGFKKETTQTCNRILSDCCDDLLQKSNGTNNKATNGLTADSLSSLSKPSTSTSQHPVPTNPDPRTPLQISALHLLTASLASIAPSHLQSSLRAKFERTAILTQNKEAMLAAVLNPPMPTSGKRPATSILPMLARADPESLQVEALLRPRMPVVRGVEALDGVDVADSEVDDDDLGGDVDGDLDGDVDDSTGVDEIARETSAEAREQQHPLKGPLQNSKRPPSPSSPDKEDTASTKRQRIDNESLATTSSQAPSRAEMVPQPTIVPDTEAESGDKEKLAVLPVNSASSNGQDASASALPNPGPMGIESDDESDISIPEITMDPDTEDEDEGEEGS